MSFVSVFWGSLISGIRSESRFRKNISWLLVGNGAALALGFFATAYLALTLGQSRFGLFSYAQTLALFAALIIDWGLNTYGNRAVARDPNQAGRYLLNIGTFQIISGFVLIIISVVITSIFHIWAGELQSVVLTSLLWVFPFALNIEWLYLGFQRMGIVGLGRLIQQTSILVATLLLVTSSQDLRLAPIARVVGGMISAAWLLLQLPRGIFHGAAIRLREAVGYFRNSRWFWLSAFLVQVYHGSDVVILKVFRTASEVGQYSAAFRLMSLGVAMISLVNVTMFPMLSAEHNKGSGAFRKLMKLHLSLAGGIALFLFVIGIPAVSLIVPWVYGEQYASAAPILSVLVVAAAILALNGALSQPLLAAGHEVMIFLQIILTAVFNVIFNLLFIPLFGGGGAAWVYLASVTFGTLLLVPVYISRLVKKPTDRGRGNLSPKIGVIQGSDLWH